MGLFLKALKFSIYTVVQCAILVAILLLAPGLPPNASFQYYE